MRKVIGIGESILDIIFQGNQPIKAVPGGSVFNTMISLGRSQVPSYFISELGNDKVGRIIRDFMNENRLNTDYIYFFNDGYSPVSMAFLDNGNAQYQFYKNFPEKRLQVSFPEINEGDILVLGSYFAVNPILREKVAELLRYASKRKAIIYYDINFRQAHAWEKNQLSDYFVENFEFASLVRCSNEDLATLYPEYTIDDIYEKILSPRCPNFIVTQGDKEILLFAGSLRKKYSVAPRKIISTIGAGDSFNAGIIYGMMQNQALVLSDIDEKQWDNWIGFGQKFAGKVCESMENYIPI